MQILHLRSPRETTMGIVYFARMLDKIRLNLRDELPPEYLPHLGRDFDGRCVHFLRISYRSLVDRVSEGGTDEEILAWAFSEARHRPDDEQIEIWNEFMRKRGWNDEASARVAERKAEAGLSDRDDIQTSFQYIDADEGRF